MTMGGETPTLNPEPELTPFKYCFENQNNMIQGTTPTIRLTFPFDARLLEKVEVSFLKGRSYGDPEIALSKTVTEITDERIEIPLTQEETRLMDGLTIIEVRAKTLTGGVIGFSHVAKVMRRTASEVDL